MDDDALVGTNSKRSLSVCLDLRWKVRNGLLWPANRILHCSQIVWFGVYAKHSTELSASHCDSTEAVELCFYIRLPWLWTTLLLPTVSFTFNYPLAQPSLHCFPSVYAFLFCYSGAGQYEALIWAFLILLSNSQPTSACVGVILVLAIRSIDLGWAFLILLSNSQPIGACVDAILVLGSTKHWPGHF